MNGKKYFWCVLLSTLILGCNHLKTEEKITSFLESQNKNINHKAIVLADISDSPQKIIRNTQPLADYLEQNLHEFDISIGKVKVAPDVNLIVQWFKSGEIDLYFDSPYPVILVQEKTGAKPILRRWKGGDAEYYGVIFSLVDNNIKSLQDLSGKMVAFDHHFSTSGYMLPLTVLDEAKLNPVKKTNAMARVNKNEVGYVFSQEDENSIAWVLNGKVDAAAVDIQTFNKVPEDVKAKFVILQQTEKLARHIVLVRPDLDPELIAKIKILLLDLDKTEEGKKILENFSNTAKFDDFPTTHSLDRMYQMYQKIQEKNDSQAK